MIELDDSLRRRRFERDDKCAGHHAFDRVGHLSGHHPRQVPGVLLQITEHLLHAIAAEGNLDDVESGPVHRLRDRLDHAGAHSPGPQALGSVAKRRVNETHVHG
jgi:hypothetical protein